MVIWLTPLPLNCPRGLCMTPKALDEGSCLIDIRTRYYAQFSVCVSLPPIAIGATAVSMINYFFVNFFFQLHSSCTVEEI